MEKYILKLVLLLFLLSNFVAYAPRLNNLYSSPCVLSEAKLLGN